VQATEQQYQLIAGMLMVFVHFFCSLVTIDYVVLVVFLLTAEIL